MIPISRPFLLGSHVVVALTVLFTITVSATSAQDVRVGNASIFDQVTDQWEPQGALRTVRMVGPRNGVASGQVVLLADRPLQKRSIQVSASDLTGPGGVLLEAERISVRYGVDHEPHRLSPDDDQSYDEYRVLANEPPDSFVRLPIWITVHMPADMPPGIYDGSLEINAGGRHTIPLRLEAGHFVLQHRRDYVSFANLIYSPDSVALRYGVRAWSQEHLQYLKPSLDLLAEVGQDVFYVTFTAGTHLGTREPLVRWVKQADGKLVPDFSALRQMAELWKERVGKPRLIVLYLWDIDQRTRDQEAVDTLQVRQLDPATGEAAELEAPNFHDPEGEAFWTPAIQGAIAVLQESGWDRDSFLLGIAHDSKPLPEIVAALARMAPGLKWDVISHGRGYGYPRNVEPVPGLIMGYRETPHSPRPFVKLAQGRKTLGGWTLDFPRLSLGRQHGTSTSMSYRMIPEGSIGGHRPAQSSNGFSRYKSDFFRVKTTDDGSDRVGELLNMSGWVNLMRNHETLLAPGPKGALATTKFQNLVEGVHSVEARIAMERILVDDHLRGQIGQELEAEAGEILVWRAEFIDQGREADPSWTGWNETEFLDQAQRLYNVAGRMIEKTGTEAQQPK